MASTAWTANRADLITALAKARTEVEARNRKQAELEAELAIARTEFEAKERERKAKALKKKHEYIARCRAGLTNDSWKPRTPAPIPTDPNAAQHRADLLAALKEKP